MLSSCLTQVTDGEATRGLKMGIILLIKKKYRKQHAAVGYKTEEGRQEKKERIGIDKAGNNKNIGNDTIKLGCSTHVMIGGCLNC